MYKKISLAVKAFTPSVLIILAFSCCSPVQMFASAGSLDTTFNPAGTPPGTVTTPIGDPASGQGVAIQSDGKIVVAGVANVAGVDQFAVARYMPDGSLDTTFNGTGTVTTPIGTGASGNAVVLQPDGKIVVAGFAVVAGVAQFAVARYKPDGSLDTTFNGTGTVTTPIGNDAQGFAVALQPDGKILVAGLAIVAGVEQFAVARYNPNGSLDTTFNGTGIVTTPIGTLAQGNAVALQPDGKIVVEGFAIVAGVREFAVVRYKPDGSLDTTFNGTGIVTTPIGTMDAQGNAFALQPDGKIVVAGFARVTGLIVAVAVARYMPDGSLDTTFNGTGIVTTPIGTEDAEGLAVTLQPNGKIVVAGFASLAGADNFAVVRYMPGGSLDMTFNGTGIVTTLIGNLSDGNAVALQPDGKIVVAGFTFDLAGTEQFAVARYNGDLPPTPPVPTNSACALRLINKYGPRL